MCGVLLEYQHEVKIFEAQCLAFEQYSFNLQFKMNTLAIIT
jgi:hypothetical protein